MGKAVKTPKEGRTKASRKQYRKSLGKLKDLTVQPKTKERYRNSLKQFFDFLKKENLSIPHKGKLWMIWCQITWSSCGPRVKDELLPVPSWQECRITILSKKIASLDHGVCPKPGQSMKHQVALPHSRKRC